MNGSRAPWKAALALTFRQAGGRSVLAERRHEGPLVVQKPLYPEGGGVCHVVLIHAPGGIAGGDVLGVDIGVESGAHALLTTPAASKWYKANGATACQTSNLTLRKGAILEWLPQESILFDHADAAINLGVKLEGDAVFAGWEIICFGRRASGEIFGTGTLRQRLQVHREDRALWGEFSTLRGGDIVMQSPAGLNGRHVFGSMVVAAGAVPAELMTECRERTPREGACGITALPEIFSARYLGASAEHARDYFESLRTILRPWYAGRPAERPRLWDT